MRYFVLLFGIWSFANVCSLVTALSDAELETLAKHELEKIRKDIAEEDKRTNGAPSDGGISKCPFSGLKSSPVLKQTADDNEAHKRLKRALSNKDIDDSQINQILSTAFRSCNRGQVFCTTNQNKYRTIDGTCNNLQNVIWGASGEPFNRFLNPGYAYKDGLDEPRGGRTVFSLPSPRAISNLIHKQPYYVPLKTITHMLPIFGQFVDHDLSLTPVEVRPCCSNPSSSSDCWPINIPFNDPFYAQFGQRCLNFTRSTAHCSSRQSGAFREQINVNTAYIDASQIYGSDAERANQLREMRFGLLKTNPSLTDFLPLTSSINSQLVSTVGNFITGDNRANEHPALTALQNLFLREHNRIARQIRSSSGCGNWNDERIFQATRRIVWAELQHIIYNEYLPVVLGPNTMSAYFLDVQPDNRLQSIQRTSYIQTTNPTILNSFATAAYRFGHSLVQNEFFYGASGATFLLSENFNAAGTTKFTNNFGKGYDWLLEGLATQKIQTPDPFVVESLRNQLFRETNRQFGSDLVTRNIQRGRDHGLPSYNEFRKACNLSSLQSWAQQPAEFYSEQWNQLQQLYSSPRDIDLFTGGLAEVPVIGGLSGPTFNCIKAHQFQRIKYGDRFFYTHNPTSNSAGFSTDELRQLSRRKLSDIICQNSQQDNVQEWVFRTPTTQGSPPGFSNPVYPCSDQSRAFNIQPFLAYNA